jgi:Holliday junction resolvase RusA-like endonuclease
MRSYVIEGQPVATPRPRAGRAKNGRNWTYGTSAYHAALTRAQDAYRAAHGDEPPLEGPVTVAVVFVFKRSQEHLSKGRRAGGLKPSAPEDYCQKPDLDSLSRWVLDSLTKARAFRDDADVVGLTAEKVWADVGEEGRTEVQLATLAESLAAA